MNKSYDQQTVRTGIITVSFAIIANFIPVLYLWIAEGVSLGFGTIMSIWGLALVTYGISWIVQPVSYFPTLGVSGTYVGWVAGSVADIRLPAANMARKAANVEDGTPAGDVMSTIGVSCSVFVSVAIITIFAIVGTNVLSSLPASITSAFNYILPAIFGAVYIDMAIKNLKLGISIFVVCILALNLLDSVAIPSGFYVLICVIAGMILSRIQFVTSKKQEE